MKTISFNKTVSYKGICYKPNEAFEVKDEEAGILLKEGATLLSLSDSDTFSDIKPESALAAALVKAEEENGKQENKEEAEIKEEQKETIKETIKKEK